MSLRNVRREQQILLLRKKENILNGLLLDFENRLWSFWS